MAVSKHQTRRRPGGRRDSPLSLLRLIDSLLLLLPLLPPILPSLACGCCLAAPSKNYDNSGAGVRIGIGIEVSKARPARRARLQGLAWHCC